MESGEEWRGIAKRTQQGESGPRARFVDQLKQSKTLAGEPTLATLQTKNPDQLQQQTVSKLLNRQFTRVPDLVGADAPAAVYKNLTTTARRFTFLRKHVRRHF